MGSSPITSTKYAGQAGYKSVGVAEVTGCDSQGDSSDRDSIAPRDILASGALVPDAEATTGAQIEGGSIDQPPETKRQWRLLVGGLGSVRQVTASACTEADLTAVLRDMEAATRAPEAQLRTHWVMVRAFFELVRPCPRLTQRACAGQLWNGAAL